MRSPNAIAPCSERFSPESLPAWFHADERHRASRHHRGRKVAVPFFRGDQRRQSWIVARRGAAGAEGGGGGRARRGGRGGGGGRARARGGGGGGRRRRT